MLLVHHDQPEIRERQEQRRARARHHAHIALGHAAPDARALLGGDGGMPLGGAAAEALLEPLQELVGQRDFGQQDQHLSVRPAQRLRDRLEIDLGFARAGHAIQQRRAEAALGDGLAKLGRRRRLALAQIRLAEIGLGSGRARARKLGADQAPASASPSITAALTWAASISRFLAHTAPSASTARTRSRAAVMRAGAAPPSRKPQRGSSASNTSRRSSSSAAPCPWAPACSSRPNRRRRG